MSILDAFDNLVLDCDGTLYVGDEPVPGAAELAKAAEEHGMNILFVTNDPARSADSIARRIRRTGIAARPEQVLHAGRAAALHVAASGHESALLIGTEPLAHEMRSVGIDTTRTVDVHGRAEPIGVDCLVVGLAPELCLEDFELMLRNWSSAMPLYAANGDRTFPMPAGPSLGNGAIAAAVGFALGIEPIVCGKPSKILFAKASEMLGPGRTLIMGDTLDADVRGGNEAGWTTVWLRRDETTPPKDAAPAGGVTPDYVVGDGRDLL